MLRRFVLVSGLMVAGALGFAGSASAQVTETVTATFSGGIGTVCTLGDPAITSAEPTFPGTLNYDTITRTFTQTALVPIAVDCSGGTLLSTVAEGTNPSPADTVVATVTDGTNNASPDLINGGASFTVATGATQLNVGLTATFPAAPDPGAYSYVVTLTGTAAQ